MLFPLWSSSIHLADTRIYLRVFLVVAFIRAEFPLRRGYYACYLCNSQGCRCSVISVVMYAPPDCTLLHAVRLVMLLSGLCVWILSSGLHRLLSARRMSKAFRVIILAPTSKSTASLLIHSANNTSCDCPALGVLHSAVKFTRSGNKVAELVLEKK
jgi:hypothetical protein